MQIIKTLGKLHIFLCPLLVNAQATYLPAGDKGYHFIDRLEIKQTKTTNLNLTTLKPYNRKSIVQEANFLDSARFGYTDSFAIDKYKTWNDIELSKVDEYNMESFLMNNTEWATGNKEDFISKTSILNTFYKTRCNFLEINKKNFFLVINPVLQASDGFEPGNAKPVFITTAGVTVRGMIFKKLGFSATISNNQERGPQFFQQYITVNNAVPGNGFYKYLKNGSVNYIDKRGYLTLNVVKHIDVQLGFDKNFIGDGYRSLFLSDWGSSNLFLKLNTKIWKLTYQNLFMQLTPQFNNLPGDVPLDKKYAAMHHLSMNVAKWLNIGLFESIIFGKRNHFDGQYLNPVMFMKHIEGMGNSSDNAFMGGDFKANLAGHIQFYGQLLLNKFTFSNITSDAGSWANTHGTQIGIKYVDAFHINNFDVQLEYNSVRPYTYAHNDSVSDYTHYNQPLAHPLGANFREFVGIINYQPSPKLYLLAKIIYYKKGLDTDGYNAGGNIFRLDTQRCGINEGYTTTGGQKAICINSSLQISYELKENLYIDLSYQYRNYNVRSNPDQNSTNALISAGIRLNIAKRQYDF